MLKKTITYEDYNGVSCTETFYFNLSKAELIEKTLDTNGNAADIIQGVIDAKDNARIMSMFKELILSAYGEKSQDGKRFIKSKELSEAFSQTEAYSALLMEFFTDPDAASQFVNGILPADLMKEAQKAQNPALPSA